MRSMQFRVWGVPARMQGSQQFGLQRAGRSSGRTGPGMQPTSQPHRCFPAAELVAATHGEFATQRRASGRTILRRTGRAWEASTADSISAELYCGPSEDRTCCGGGVRPMNPSSRVLRFSSEPRRRSAAASCSASPAAASSPSWLDSCRGRNVQESQKVVDRQRSKAAFRQGCVDGQRQQMC